MQQLDHVLDRERLCDAALPDSAVDGSENQTEAALILISRA
jgi:hypothetical protein